MVSSILTEKVYYWIWIYSDEVEDKVASWKQRGTPITAGGVKQAFQMAINSGIEIEDDDKALVVQELLDYALNSIDWLSIAQDMNKRNIYSQREMKKSHH